MEEKSNATAIPRFDDEHKEFIEERLLHHNTYWQVVDLFMVMYPDFQPEGVSLNYYRNQLYRRIVDYAKSPRNPMSKEIKAAHKEQDEQIVKIAQTDKFKQLVMLTNFIENEWQPRTFVKTATDENGDPYPVYKSNIGELMKCHARINKLSDELGLVTSNGKGTQPHSGPAKPVNKRVAAARKAGAPAPGEQVPTNEFPSTAGPPPKDEEDVSSLSKREPIVKI